MSTIKRWGARTEKLALTLLEAGYALTGHAFVGILRDGTVRLRVGWTRVTEIDVTEPLDYNGAVELIQSRHGARHA